MPPKTKLTVEKVAVDTLIQHPHNARRGDVAMIADSLQRHGLYKPLVRQRATGHVLVGNHTLQAAIGLGWTEIEVVTVDVDDEEATRILLVDNRSNDVSRYDDEALTELLSGLPTLEGTGFTDDDLDDLLATTNLPGPAQITKQAGNGGKALTGLGLQWGFVQWSQRRVPITADEVARLDAVHDAFVARTGTEAGFVHALADAMGSPQIDTTTPDEPVGPVELVVLPTFVEPAG